MTPVDVAAAFLAAAPALQDDNQSTSLGISSWPAVIAAVRWRYNCR